MADSKELRAIVGAMTVRPWVADDDTPCLYSGCMEVAVLGDEAQNYDGDGAAIAALANHADALVELVAACERMLAGTGLSRWHDVECFCVDCELRKALAKVHAVGKEGK